MRALYHLFAAILIGFINTSWEMRLLASIGWSSVALTIPWLRLPGYSSLVLFLSLSIYIFILSSIVALISHAALPGRLF
jgi:hypothetical protein